MKAFIRKSTYFTIVFVIINLFFTGVAFGQATVSTDLLDYPPGATAIITGSGFQAGETVTLLVVHTGDNPLGTDEEYHQPWTVLADGSGNIETSYYIPTVEEGDALGATFLLTADGQTSLLHAEWIFTDGNVNFKTSGLPNGTTVTVSVNSVTVSGTSPNIGGYGATNGSNVYYSYPISIDVSGTTYNLQSTTPASGFISSNAATNVTATYSTLKLNQNITFNALSDKTYGDVPFAISATASSLLPVSFSILNGPATISGNTITITGAGTVTVRASQAGNGTYLAAPNVDQTFTVNKASLAVTAIASDITYGDPAPTVSVTYSGFLGTDNAAGLDNVGFSLGTDYTQYNVVGTYNTTIALGTALDNNYNFTPLNPSTFAVGKANLAVTAIASDITYGDPAPTVSVNYSGFLGTDNAAGLDNVGFSLGTDYTQYNAVGTYNTTIALGTALDNNYNFTLLNPSTFAVGKANLAVTAIASDITYGDPAPTVSVNYSGFLGTDNAAGLDNVGFSLGTDYTQYNAVGTYNTTIALGTALDNNYNFTPLNPSTFAVGKANLAVTAIASDITYGDPAPTVSVNYSGFLGTDNAAGLDNVGFSLGTDYTQYNAVGTYNTTIALGTALDNNYNFTPLNPSTFAVGKANLAVTAIASDITYGDPAPTVSVTYSGFLGTDNAAGLDNVGFSLGTDYTQYNAVGTYNTTIALGTALDNNYNFTPLNPSTFAVGKANLAVTAIASDITYGDPAPTVSVTYSGFLGTDNAAGLDNVGFSLGTDYTQYNAVGTYNTTIALGTALDNNYNFTPLNPSTFAVGKANLAVTAIASDITYGDPAPTVSVTYSGFLGTDNAAGLDNVGFSLGTDYTQYNAVGTYNTTIALGTALDNNYNFTPLNPSTFAVGKANLAVTAIASDITYGDPAPTVSVTYSGFLGTDNAAGLDNVGFSLGTDYTQYNAVGTYNTTIALGTALDNNYNFTPLNPSTFAVGKANLAVTAIASDITYGDPAPTVSVTYSGFLGTDNAAGLDNVGFSLGTDYTQYNAVGTYNTTIALGTALDNNYNFTPLNPSTFAVGKANLAVTAIASDITYGDPAPTVSVTYSGFLGTDNAAGLDNVGFSLGTDYTQYNAVGTYNTTIALGTALDNNYNFTPLNPSTFAVGKANLAVTAIASDITYGDPAPTVSVTYSGFLGTDNAAGLDNVGFSLGTDYTQYNAVGTYNTTIALGTALDNNYNFTPLNPSTFAVGKANLAVTAIASDITYGDPAPTVSVTYSGFLGTDNAAGLDNVGFSLGTDYTQYNAVGTYNTTIALGTALDNNYNFTPLNTSTFAVGKANLAVTAIASDITYGDPAPTVSVTYSGFLGTDNAAGLDNVGFSLGTDYTQYNAVGTYNTTIALGTALDNNYNFTPLNTSTFAVGKANLAVTAEDKSRQYSDSNPEWTVTYSGFVNNETPTVLGGTLIFTGTGPSSNGSTPPGPSYVITPSGLTSNNYQIFFVNGYLTIINEKACGTYNGTYFKNTSSPTTMTTTVLLSVVVNQEEDGSLIALNPPSNINFAFNLSSFDNNATVSLIGSPVFNSSTSTFTQSANVTIKTGNVSSILDLSWTIGKYFTNIDVSCQDQRSVITVALPGSDFSAGGGFLILGENSGGTKNGLAGTKNNFGYNIKWGKNFSKLTGNFNTIWRQNGISFQAKSNSAAALIVSKIPNTSPVRYKAQITYTNVSMKQLDCLVNCWSDGNGTVTLTVYDWGEPGSNGSQTVKDQIGFAVKDKNGVLIYSTNTFTYTQGISDPTAVLNLDGGNIQARSSVVNGGSSGTTQTVKVATEVKEIPAESVLFNIKAYPNPTANQFTLVIEGGSNEKVEVLVYDLLGRTVKHIENSDNQLINFGEELQADTYIVVVSQGTNRKTLRLIKQ